MKRQEVKKALEKVKRHDGLEEYYEGGEIKQVDVQLKGMICGFPYRNILGIHTWEDEVELVIQPEIDTDLVVCSHKYDELKEFKVQLLGEKNDTKN